MGKGSFFATRPVSQMFFPLEVGSSMIALFKSLIWHYNSIYTIICLKSVDVRRLQVAILARSPREMSQTDRILPRYFLSRVRVSVRPRIFYTRKKLPNHSRPNHWPSAPPTVRTAQQFERHFISSRQVATYVTIHTNGYGWFCWRPKTTPV